MAGRLGVSRGGSATAQRTSGVVVPEGVTLDTSDPGERIYSSRTAAGDLLEFAVSNLSESSANVNFFVNGNIIRRGEIEPSSGRTIALRVRSIMRADVASRPDGYRYSASAAQGDGLGAVRARLYQRAGFSRPRASDDIQFAVVRNGRLVPSNQAGAAIS